jgi:predicted transglutaminase-like cysteine proteinase
MVTYRTLLEVQKKLWSLFDYVPDQKNYQVPEDWRSHYDAVSRSERFSDDCDGFAMTACEMLLKKEADPDDVMFIICKTETGGMHAVAGYNIGHTTFIMDCRYRQVYSLTSKPSYKWLFFMKFSEKGEWRQV